MQGFLVASLATYSLALKLDTYFLNKDYDHLKSQCPSCPDIECLHSDNETLLPLPETLTFCYRSQAMVYENYLATWSSVISFGTIRPDFRDLQQGVLFGIWETGPWLAIKYSVDGPYNWLGLGSSSVENLQVWRHTCFTLDFQTGVVKLVENGKFRFQAKSDFKPLRSTMNHVAIGCAFRGKGGTGYQSMYGRVTDAQFFGRTLSDEEMIKITSCNERMKGDIVDWNSAEWIITGPNKNIKKEKLDFDKVICKFQTNS